MLLGSCNREVAFRRLRASPSSSICLSYQFPFEYITLKDKQAYVGGYNSKRALYEFCLILYILRFSYENSLCENPVRDFV